MRRTTCAAGGCDRNGRHRGLCPMHRKRMNVHGSLDLPQPPTDAERFWALVERSGPDECWPWTGGTWSGPYGVFYVERKAYKAHRWVYLHTHGPIPVGMFVCHRCDNPPCVNPAHLFIGTAADNNRDRAAKGRSSGQGNPKLNERSVREMRSLADSGWSTSALAGRFEVEASTVRRIVARKTWRAVA